jgi:hypothetical protein
MSNANEQDNTAGVTMADAWEELSIACASDENRPAMERAAAERRAALAADDQAGADGRASAPAAVEDTDPLAGLGNAVRGTATNGH